MFTNFSFKYHEFWKSNKHFRWWQKSRIWSQSNGAGQTNLSGCFRMTECVCLAQENCRIRKKVRQGNGNTKSDFEKRCKQRDPSKGAQEFWGFQWFNRTLPRTLGCRQHKPRDACLTEGGTQRRHADSQDNLSLLQW